MKPDPDADLVSLIEAGQAVRDQDKPFNRKQRCSSCGQVGHTKRWCKR